MTFLPLKLMLERVERHGADSDISLFNELLYAGEFVLKLTTAAFVSAVQNDREGHRYRLLHSLVRADGIGDWARALDEALTGPASQQLVADFSDIRKVFTERLGKGSWQHEAAKSLQEVIAGLTDGDERTAEKVAFRAWFQSFTELRNKTRGHGALTPAKCARLVPKLSASIQVVCANNPIFVLPWAYIYRNLSGKYKVTAIGEEAAEFKRLTQAAAATGENYPNGVYLWTGKSGGYRRVELIYTDPDVVDFFFPNGAFKNSSFELHSLITDSRLNGDATPYLATASERPPSETEGKCELDCIGHVFTNLPSLTPGYVHRPHLEEEARAVMTNDRHPIITLVGRGGIGKTSLALAILHDIAETERYQVIIWFSSRDIDLLMSGAKSVQPRVLTDREISEEYLTLIGDIKTARDQKINPTVMMAEHLRKSPHGPTLFVFDNFETVRSPVDLFQWIDTNIRLPNKAVITTRFRDFKADYPVEVSGMEQDEAEALVAQTAASLGIEELIGKKERDLLIEESNCHPYVIKIMLGEIANAGAFSKPIHLMVRKEEILDALFERTFANLSPMASRIFLTLSGWRSLVPKLAVEALLLRHGNDGGDPEAGVDQLIRMSLIERAVAGDGADFLEVPLTASLFGRRKLEVSPIRAVIENDIRFLQDIGATTSTGLKGGIRPRIEAFFKRAARRISEGDTTFHEMRPVLEFLARGCAPAWLLLSELVQELDPHSANQAAEYIRRFLESKPPTSQAQEAWQRLVFLYRSTGDVIGGTGAFLKAAETMSPSIDEVSLIANWLNQAPELKGSMDVVERRDLCKPLVRLMEARLPEASATDLSRLAWLHLHCGDAERALEVSELGIKRDPDNIHCQRLVLKLTVGV